MKNDKQIDVIQIRGARTHNLKNINVDILMNQITCVAGPSGSGKSSLAFHTLLVESKRRFINSLPNDMKFFWEIPHTVEVDSIFPVLPAWGLPQHNPMINSRPVALDVLGGHERLQKIFMELGRFVCPVHHEAFQKVSSFSSVIKKIEITKNLNDEDVLHIFLKNEDYRKYISADLFPNRSMRLNVGDFSEDDPWYELIRVKIKNLTTIKKKLEEFSIPDGVIVRFHLFGAKKNWDVENNIEWKCPHCELKAVETKLSQVESLSPLNALGACPHCQGHGMLLVYDREKLVKDPTKTIREGAINFLLFSRFEHLFPAFLRECKKIGLDVDLPFRELPESKWKFLYQGHGKYEGFNSYFDYLKSLRYKKNIRIYVRSMQKEILCEECDGTRVSAKAGSLSIVLSKKIVRYKDFLKLNFQNALLLLEEIMSDQKETIKHEKLEISFNKIKWLYSVACDLSLGHLQNTRKVRSLSSSEYQRILLSKYFCYEGSQSLFVLDEPSLGLSLSTQEKMLKYLYKLRDQGNTILIVEHSEYLKSMADEIIEMGPGAGALGGEILFQGKYKSSSLVFPKFNFKSMEKKSFIEILEASIRGLHKKELKIEKNVINWAYGESGTGKTSFLVNILANEVYKKVYGSRLNFEEYTIKKIKGIDDFEDVILINSGLDKISSRSTVATFTDLGAFVRKYFANLDVSKKLGLKEGHFSANSELGQCSSCEGRGVKLVEMHFMEDVEFVCEDCQGKKIKPYYANISDGNLSAYEAFSKPLSDVLPFIKLTPKGKRIWEYFKILKLDYLSLDRSLTSLSGGERQRLQLLSLLDKKVENTLIIFENLTSGLSRYELSPLAQLLHQLSGSQNTLIVIDQNAFFGKIAQHRIEF